jgi:flagellar biosynthesis protein FlhG
MLAPRATRRIAVLACEPGGGATTVALGLANALAMQGERVLVVDEDRQRSHATKLAGATPQGTLAQVLAGRIALADAVGARPPAAPGVLAGSDAASAAGADEALQAVRTVLVDARADAQGALSPFAAAAHNVVVVMRPELASITATYAGIKRLHHLYACRRFHLVVNMAGAEGAVGALTRNLAHTARQYLGVEATLAGYLPADPLVMRSTQLGRCVVDAYPAAPATSALRRIAASIGGWPLQSATRAASPAEAHA